MNPSSLRRSAPRLAACVAALFALTACDKLMGDDEEKKEDEASAKAEDDKPAEDEKKEDEKKEEDDAKKPEDEAKLAAEAEAKRIAEEAEAKRIADEEAKKKQPLVLSDMEVVSRGGMFGSGGSLELKAKAKLNEKLASSTYVHVKAMCKKDDQVISDVGYLNADYSKPLEQYEAGEEAAITGTIFTQGLTAALSPCKLEFRLGGFGGISVPVGDFCYDGSSTKEGKCEPEIAAIALSGATKPLEIAGLAVKAGGGYGGGSGLGIDYSVKVNKPQDQNARLTLKTACDVGGKKLVDLTQANMSSGPFTYESGESLARSGNLFWNPAFAFTAAPDTCDVTFALWTNKPGAWGSYDVTEISRSCYKSGAVSDGACDPSKPTSGTAAKITKENLELSDVTMTLQEPYGAAGKKQLVLQVDATAKEFIDQQEGINATVTCKVGSEKRVETAYLFSVDLYYLEPGETTRMSSTSFTSPPMDSAPKSCEVAFTGGQRYSPSGTTAVDLGKFCLKKDKVKAGKC
jgi:hypothetical protein